MKHYFGIFPSVKGLVLTDLGNHESFSDADERAEELADGNFLWDCIWIVTEDDLIFLKQSMENFKIGEKK